MARGLRIGFSRDVRLPADVASFVLSGIAANLSVGGGGGGSAPTDVAGPAGSASFSVGWEAPAYDAGYGAGGGVADVAGYVIDYATTSQTPLGTYPFRKVVAGGASVSGTVSSIAAGTYYLRMASYDSGGNIGDYGVEITKVAA